MTYVCRLNDVATEVSQRERIAKRLRAKPVASCAKCMADFSTFLELFQHCCDDHSSTVVSPTPVPSAQVGYGTGLVKLKTNQRSAINDDILEETFSASGEPVAWLADNQSAIEEHLSKLASRHMIRYQLQLLVEFERASAGR